MVYLCCVCDNRAKKDSEFCSECEVIYTPVKNESWFLELTRLMKKQRWIDDKEKYSLHGAAYAQLLTRNKRKIGRPKLSPVMEEIVLNIKRDNPTASVRQIEAMCRKAGVIVSRETIRRLTQNMT